MWDRRNPAPLAGGNRAGIGSDEERGPDTTDWRQALARRGFYVHAAADRFDLLDDDEIARLAADIEEHGLRSPLALWRPAPGAPPLLLDGRNRVRAMLRLPDADLLLDGALGGANVYEAERTGPLAFVISANLLRRHLTPEQKRALIAEFLKADPSRSNRSIAAITQASHHTVSNVRNSLEGTGQIAQLTKIVGSDGKMRAAHNAAPRPSPESVVGQFRVASSPAAPRPAPSVVGAFSAGGSTHAAAPPPTPSLDFEVRASKFLDAVAEQSAVFRSGTLSQRCWLADRFLREIDVAIEELERFVNSPDDGGAA
jgi:hypothetical protein